MSLHNILARLIWRPRLENKLHGLTARQAERKLRDAGMSQRQAKRYIAERRASLELDDPP